jgi:hypothetical protein
MNRQLTIYSPSRNTPCMCATQHRFFNQSGGFDFFLVSSSWLAQSWLTGLYRPWSPLSSKASNPVIEVWPEIRP